MGRVAKHYTDEARAKATQEKRREYSQTKTAKILRKEQNRRAYEKRTGGRSKLIPTWPTIPRAIRQQGSLALPTSSPIFVNEFRYGGEISDDDELAVWDFYPPYRMRPGSLGSQELEDISIRVHGRRLRDQQLSERSRLQRYQKGSDDDILSEIDRDIQTYLTSWTDLKILLQGLPETVTIDLTMGLHLLQWKARRIVDLLADWKIAKKGRSQCAFPTHFANRWSLY